MTKPAAHIQRYRRIAVTVEARADGFRWQLLESEDEHGAWQVLSTARESVQQYRAAMADGLLALQALVDDLDAGPQKEANPQEKDDSEPQLQRPRGAFGFGQLR